MKRPKLNLVIDAAMLVALAAIGGIGLLMKYVLIPGKDRWAVYGRSVDLYWLGLDRHEWGTIHLWVGCVFLALLVLHLALHWNTIVGIYRRLVRSRALRVLVAVILVFVCAALFAFAAFVKPGVIERSHGEGHDHGGGGRRPDPDASPTESPRNRTWFDAAVEDRFLQAGAGGFLRPAAGPPDARAEARAPSGGRPLRVVCFGDSITGLKPRAPYHHAFLKFSDLLELLLEGRLGLGGAAVLNRGLTGDATYARPSRGLPGAVIRFRKDVLDERPDVAIVLVCGNDRKGSAQDKALTRKNLVAIFSAAKREGIRVLALGYHVVPNPANPETAWRHLDDFNPLIAGAAADCGIAYLDMGPPMEAAAKRYPIEELVHPTDGVHLRPRGEMVYARTLFRKLDELGWVAPPAAGAAAAE